jgi:hypothetical protein
VKKIIRRRAGEWDVPEAASFRSWNPAAGGRRAEIRSDRSHGRRRERSFRKMPFA